jgi:hypothetical protein
LEAALRWQRTSHGIMETKIPFATTLCPHLRGHRKPKTLSEVHFLDPRIPLFFLEAVFFFFSLNQPAGGRADSAVNIQLFDAELNLAMAGCTSVGRAVNNRTDTASMSKPNTLLCSVGT